MEQCFYKQGCFREFFRQRELESKVPFVSLLKIKPLKLTLCYYTEKSNLNVGKNAHRIFWGQTSEN